MKIMKTERNRNRRNKMQRKHTCEEFESVFMTCCNEEENSTIETRLLSNELTIKDLENNDEYWIGDTGTIIHITNHSARIYSCAYPTGASKLVMGNGTKVTKNLDRPSIKMGKKMLLNLYLW